MANPNEEQGRRWGMSPNGPGGFRRSGNQGQGNQDQGEGQEQVQPRVNGGRRRSKRVSRKNKRVSRRSKQVNRKNKRVSRRSKQVSKRR